MWPQKNFIIEPALPRLLTDFNWCSTISQIAIRVLGLSCAHIAHIERFPAEEAKDLAAQLPEEIAAIFGASPGMADISKMHAQEFFLRPLAVASTLAQRREMRRTGRYISASRSY